MVKRPLLAPLPDSAPRECLDIRPANRPVKVPALSLVVDAIESEAVFLDDTVEDDKGHDSSCIFAWHCYAVTLHTSTGTMLVKCWSDHICLTDHWRTGK